MSQPLTFCTILCKNYLAQARVLAASLRRHHPESRLKVLVVDATQDWDGTNEPFEILRLEALSLPNLSDLCFQYFLWELATAVKPRFLKFLIKHGAEKLVYLDPDIVVYHPLKPVESWLETSSILLTPHVTQPCAEGDPLRDRDLLLYGTYNLGFIALRAGATTQRFLDWWDEKLERGCRADPANGYFVDQRWLDLAPAYFEGVRAIREPGFNVAFWNLPYQPLHWKGSSPWVQSSPCYFFHFSGFLPQFPDRVSKHPRKFLSLSEVGEAQSLYRRYAESLKAEGYERTHSLPYAFDCYDNGERISKEARHFYLELSSAERRFGNPFATSEASSFHRFWTEKYAKQGQRDSIDRAFTFVEKKLTGERSPLL